METSFAERGEARVLCVTVQPVVKISSGGDKEGARHVQSRTGHDGGGRCFIFAREARLFCLPPERDQSADKLYPG